jgi:hypothetical protein
MNTYTFKNFEELATPDGFNYPIDVSYGTVYLGTIVAEPDGFVIQIVDTPKGKQNIKSSPSNKFKSQDLAAEVLHRTWKTFRFGGYDTGDTGEPVAV